MLYSSVLVAHRSKTSLGQGRFVLDDTLSPHVTLTWYPCANGTEMLSKSSTKDTENIFAIAVLSICYLLIWKILQIDSGANSLLILAID